MSTIPTFLTRLPESLEALSERDGPIDCNFDHASPFGSSRAYWWPPAGDAIPETVFIFIPGNPGLAAFYIPFLSNIHSSASSESLAILTHTHVGCSDSQNSSTWPLEEHVNLVAQIAALIEIVDAVIEEFGSKVNVVLGGHSMGAWLATQVLKARPDNVASLLLLFPTISNIASTPNGTSLSWLFRPSTRNLVASLCRVTPWIPRFVLAALFPSYPAAQLSVLRTLITSPRVVHTCLSLARDEMRTIKELDVSLLRSHDHKLHLYFAERDGWVGQEREKIISSLQKTDVRDGPAIKVVRGPKDIPHAFCINHGEPVASQCVDWLRNGGYL